jgi:hypothetical protein
MRMGRTAKSGEKKSNSKPPGGLNSKRTSEQVPKTIFYCNQIVKNRFDGSIEMTQQKQALLPT